MELFPVPIHKGILIRRSTSKGIWKESNSPMMHCKQMSMTLGLNPEGLVFPVVFAWSLLGSYQEHPWNPIKILPAPKWKICCQSKQMAKRHCASVFAQTFFRLIEQAPSYQSGQIISEAWGCTEYRCHHNSKKERPQAPCPYNRNHESCSCVSQGDWSVWFFSRKSPMAS